MSLIFEPIIPTVAIAGQQERMPVRRIFCVGRNYAAHAREMGKDPDAEPPFFFTKPADAIVASGSTVAYPPQTENFHYEAELVVAIGREAQFLAPAEVDKIIFGYGVGIDLTRRDLQMAARDMGRPWDWGKAFDQSAPCSEILPAEKLGGIPNNGAISLTVNGEVRQSADLSDMIWGVRDILSIISHSMTLKPGDLIFTGTPENVGPLNPGDCVEAVVENIGRVQISIDPRKS